MNINAETELLNELIMVQEQIEFCFDQKSWSQVILIDERCQSVLQKVNEFAKTGASVLLKLQVEALIRSYRELLTRSIYEQKTLDSQEEELMSYQEKVHDKSLEFSQANVQ